MNMSHIMKLSVELREMILKNCLVVGKVYPHPRPREDDRYDGWESSDKPVLALLRVSKEVNALVKKTLFGKDNVFVMPRGHKR